MVDALIKRMGEDGFKLERKDAGHIVFARELREPRGGIAEREGSFRPEENPCMRDILRAFSKRVWNSRMIANVSGKRSVEGNRLMERVVFNLKRVSHLERRRRPQLLPKPSISERRRTIAERFRRLPNHLL